jgi:hypothetical protein
MVAEMVAVLHFDMSQMRLNERTLCPKDQACLFGSSFEKLGQERRVRVLSVLRIVDENQVALFDTIRTIRRKYLHLWSQDHESLPDDALQAYRSAVLLVDGVIGQEIVNNRIALSPALIHYLERGQEDARGSAEASD